MLSTGVNYVRIHDKYGVQYMIKQKWKIRKNGILVEKQQEFTTHIKVYRSEVKNFNAIHLF